MGLLTFVTAFLLSILSLARGQDDCVEELPDGTECSGPPKYFPDPNDCRMLYFCYRGCFTHNTCDLDWLYDETISDCNHPELVDCGSRPGPTTTTTTATTTATKTTATTTTTTPTTQTVTTTQTTTTTTPMETTTTTEPCISKLPTGSNCPASHDRGPEPDPDDCTAFWMCHDGCAFKTQCEVGTMYDMTPSVKACVANDMVDCKATHRPCASEIHCSCVDRLPHPQQFEECSEDSDFDENFLVDENDCLSFFNCPLGCFDHYSCGTKLNPGTGKVEGLLWKQSKDWCDFPENVQCGTRPCNDPERCHGDNKPDPTSDPTTTKTTTTTIASTTTTPDCGHTGFCEENSQ